MFKRYCTAAIVGDGQLPCTVEGAALYFNGQGLGCCGATTVAGDAQLPSTVEGGASVVDNDLDAVGVEGLVLPPNFLINTSGYFDIGVHRKSAFNRKKAAKGGIYSTNQTRNRAAAKPVHLHDTCFDSFVHSDIQTSHQISTDNGIILVICFTDNVGPPFPVAELQKQLISNFIPRFCNSVILCANGKKMSNSQSMCLRQSLEFNCPFVVKNHALIVLVSGLNIVVRLGIMPKNSDITAGLSSLEKIAIVA